VSKIFRRFLYAIAVTAVVAVLTAGGLSQGVFGGFQRRATDSLFPSAKTDPQVVVVGIDSATIPKAGGQVPIPRNVDAQIGQTLADAGASVVVWDVVFSAPKPGDDLLAKALAAPPATVLSEAITAKQGTGDLLDLAKVDLAPIEALSSGRHTTIGQVLVTPDPSDGVVRTVPLVVSDHGNPVPSLALEAFRALHGDTDPITIRENPQGIQTAGHFIPTEGTHLLRLNFADGLSSDHAVQVVSAADVLDGNFPRTRFLHKVVFVGATAPILGDSKLVPVDKSNTFPGVMIHANALNTMLTASYLEPVSHTESTLWVALIALLAAVSVLFLPLWLALIANFILGVGNLLIEYVRFDQSHVMNFVYAILGQVVAFMAALGIKYVTETRQRRRVSSLFAQYVPEEVARQLEESGSLESHIEGERVDVGLFFCDLRGFTSLSATLEPQQVRGMLNHFYDLLTEIIHSHGGTVLKFVGDEVFAVFGAPLPCPNNAQATLDCAMEIQTRASELDSYLADLHIPPVQFGIGMNAGDVVAAHIGGGRRRQYDIVGDTVNLGSRLCSQAGKGEIVLPEKMIDRLTTKPPMESMGAVQLKGLDEPVPLFKVVVDASVAVPR
jgi:adenylate cyclase